MKSWIVIAVTLLVCKEPSNADMPQLTVPNDPWERQVWISENYSKLKELQFSMLKLPADYPRESSRSVSKELAEAVGHGSSFKVVLAVLGMPHWHGNESGGSGPPTMPKSWWVYNLPDNNQVSFTLNLDDSLRDVVVANRVILSPESRGYRTIEKAKIPAHPTPDPP